MSDILVLAETEGNYLHSTAGELIAAGRKLADELGNQVCAVITDDADESSFKNLIHLGADKVYVISHAELSKGNIDAFVSYLEQICLQINPNVILTSRTYMGRNVGARIAYRLESGVAQDCIDVEIDKNSSRVIATRPVYGGNAVARFTFNQDDPQVIILRVKSFDPNEIDTNRDGKISPDELRIALFSFGIKTDDATAKATFAAADTDSSGDVSFEEFSRFVKNGDGDASKAFKRGLLGVA